MENFWLAFVPLFVAFDAVGLLPIFIGLTEGLGRSEVNKIILQSIITASIVALGFIAIGETFLILLGVTIYDFMIAGGLILLVISITDITSPSKKVRISESGTMGAMPIGVPLMVGPAVLTTSLILLRQYGVLPTVIAVVTNIIIAGILFRFTENIIKVLGKAGARTLSKLANMLLAAIAVMIMRRGIMMLIGS